VPEVDVHLMKNQISNLYRQDTSGEQIHGCFQRCIVGRPDCTLDFLMPSIPNLLPLPAHIVYHMTGACFLQYLYTISISSRSYLYVYLEDKSTGMLHILIRLLYT
jgi:hypothetical protein